MEHFFLQNWSYLHSTLSPQTINTPSTVSRTVYYFTSEKCTCVWVISWWPKIGLEKIKRNEKAGFYRTSSKEAIWLCVENKDLFLPSICSCCRRLFLHSRSKQRGSIGIHRIIWWNTVLNKTQKNIFKYMN